MDLPDSLNLHVEGRLSEADAVRQTRSAQIILQRLKDQPGLILGDEVGMGKTFVALAVAATHIVRMPGRPVVVMVPAEVLAKWERDCNAFRDMCLRSEAERAQFRVRAATTGLDFLKALDEKAPNHPTLILLSHTALSRTLTDKWARLALLQAAVKGRHGVGKVRARIANFGRHLLGMGRQVKKELLRRLLDKHPSEWKPVLVEAGLLEANADDPVPRLFIETVEQLDPRPFRSRSAGAR
jgi:hypothetical protein